MRLAAGWDLLVVDEAHHLVWHPESASAEYRLVEQLAEVIPGVLLLTATPEQLGRTATSPVCACSTRIAFTTSTPSAPRAPATSQWPKPCRNCSTRVVYRSRLIRPSMISSAPKAKPARRRH